MGHFVDIYFPSRIYIKSLHLVSLEPLVREAIIFCFGFQGKWNVKAMQGIEFCLGIACEVH